MFGVISNYVYKLYVFVLGYSWVPASVGYAQKLCSLTNCWLTYRLLEMLRPLLTFCSLLMKWLWVLYSIYRPTCITENLLIHTIKLSSLHSLTSYLKWIIDTKNLAYSLHIIIKTHFVKKKNRFISLWKINASILLQLSMIQYAFRINTFFYVV